MESTRYAHTRDPTKTSIPIKNRMILVARETHGIKKSNSPTLKGLNSTLFLNLKLQKIMKKLFFLFLISFTVFLLP